MNSPAFPTTFNNTAALGNYAKDVGIIFGGFGVVAIIMSAVMICVFIKFCCSRPKESVEFDKKVHLGVAIAVVIVALVGCAVGWSYNKQCNDGVQSMTGSVSGLLNSSGNLIDNIDDTIIGISTKLDARVADISSIKFDGLLAPIDEILNLIDGMQGMTNNLYYVTQGASDNVTIMKRELGYVGDHSGELGLTGVPSPNDITNIDQSFLDSIVSANNSIIDMRNTTLNVRANVNDTLTTIDTELIGSLNAQTDSYHNKVNDLTNNFDDIRTDLNNYDIQYKKTYKTTINKYSEQRTSVVNAILILPIVVALMTGAGVFFKMPKLLSITCALSFIFFFWYILIAGVNYTLYVVTNGFCVAQPTIVDGILSGMDSTFTVPGTNNSFPTGKKVGELIQCSGETTFISVFEAQFLISDLQNSIREQAQNISRKAHSANFDDDFRNATKDLADYRNNTVDLDFDQAKNLTDVTERLDNNTRQINNTIVDTTQRRDFFLSKVNDITTNTKKNDGTPVPPETFDANSIMTLNCNSAKWDDTQNQTDLCKYANTTVQLNLLLVVEISVKDNITDINVKVGYLEVDIGIVEGTQDTINDNVRSIGIKLNSSYDQTNAMIAVVDNAVNGIMGVIADGVGELGSDTNCAFVGKFYSDFSNGFCQKLTPSLRVIAAMMILGGASLFGSAVVSAVSIYKIRGSDDDYDDEV